MAEASDVREMSPLELGEVREEEGMLEAKSTENLAANIGPIIFTTLLDRYVYELVRKAFSVDFLSAEEREEEIGPYKEVYESRMLKACHELFDFLEGIENVSDFTVFGFLTSLDSYIQMNLIRPNMPYCGSDVIYVVLCDILALFGDRNLAPFTRRFIFEMENYDKRIAAINATNEWYAGQKLDEVYIKCMNEGGPRALEGWLTKVAVPEEKTDETAKKEEKLPEPVESNEETKSEAMEVGSAATEAKKVVTEEQEDKKEIIETSKDPAEKGIEDPVQILAQEEAEKADQLKINKRRSKRIQAKRTRQAD